MNEYTEEDFKNARFAEHPDGRIATRDGGVNRDMWMDIDGEEYDDLGMCLYGWRPVHERDLDEARKLRADNEALRDQLQARQDVIEMQREVVKEHIDSNHDLRNQIKDLQASLHAPAPLGLDTLREAWENAEVTTECRVGDWIIGWLPEAKHFTFHVATIGASSLPPHSRVYRRAPQPEPWADLADELGTYGVDVSRSLAQELHRAGWRKTGGDEA